MFYNNKKYFYVYNLCRIFFMLINKTFIFRRLLFLMRPVNIKKNKEPGFGVFLKSETEYIRHNN
jgi:hypothetical protein